MTIGSEVSVGIRVPFELFESGTTALRRGVEAIASAGIDRMCIGDHVSFRGGQGYDGLVQATALAALTDIEVQTAIYLLALRHPVTVARQLSTLALIAPRRLVFGVGVGGDDPQEYVACGVDPATRGRRMNESMEIVRALLDGRTVTRTGGFFELTNVRVEPMPPSPIPFVVGGRSDAAPNGSKPPPKGSAAPAANGSTGATSLSGAANGSGAGSSTGGRAPFLGARPGFEVGSASVIRVSQTGQVMDVMPRLSRAVT